MGDKSKWVGRGGYREGGGRPRSEATVVKRIKISEWEAFQKYKRNPRYSVGKELYACLRVLTYRVMQLQAEYNSKCNAPNSPRWERITRFLEKIGKILSNDTFMNWLVSSDEN